MRVKKKETLNKNIYERKKEEKEEKGGEKREPVIFCFLIFIYFETVASVLKNQRNKNIALHTTQKSKFQRTRKKLSKILPGVQHYTKFYRN